MKTYGNASSVSHWINLGMVIIAWANAMMVAILPRFAWMNPETSGQITLIFDLLIFLFQVVYLVSSMPLKACFGVVQLQRI